MKEELEQGIRIKELEQGIEDLYVERDDLADRLRKTERELLALKIVHARTKRQTSK